MADPIQTARIVEAMLHAIVPGGAEVWAWLPADDAWTPSETARSVMEAALSTAYPMIMEGCAGRVEAMALELSLRIDELARRARTPRRRLDALSEARSALYKAATTIRATELAKGEE